MSIWQDMLSRLTDAYSRLMESRIARLLRIAADELSELRMSYVEICYQRGIDYAEGATLDRIGVNVQQFRGVADDDVYRVLIRTKIARNRSDGAIETVIEALAVALGIPAAAVSVRELWGPPDNEPAAVFVDVPIAGVGRLALSITQFGRLVNRLVAAGVRAWVGVQGTFAFSMLPDASEYDDETGFADLEQTQGGTLGAIYDPATEPDLPL